MLTRTFAKVVSGCSFLASTRQSFEGGSQQLRFSSQEHLVEVESLGHAQTQYAAPAWPMSSAIRIVKEMARFNKLNYIIPR